MRDLSLRLGPDSQRFYKRLRLDSESCLEDSDSNSSLAEIVESEALPPILMPSKNLIF